MFYAKHIIIFLYINIFTNILVVKYGSKFYNYYIVKHLHNLCTIKMLHIKDMENEIDLPFHDLTIGVGGGDGVTGGLTIGGDW